MSRSSPVPTTSDSDPATVLEAGKQVLDLVAPSVEVCIMGKDGLTARSGGDAGLNVSLDQCVAELVGIISMIVRQSPNIRQG